MTGNNKSLPALAYAVDSGRCYFGETVTFFTRLAVHQAVPGPVVVRVFLPRQLEPVPEPNRTWTEHQSCEKQTHRVVTWPPADPDRVYEYRIQARVKTKSLEDLHLKSWAEVRQQAGPEGATGPLPVRSEVVPLCVPAKARLMAYLPGIYHDEANALLWRYLMLFDRTLARYEELLSTLPYYFDARLAPPDFQSWLAAWVGLAQSSLFSDEEHQRRLGGRMLPKMVRLYRKRGTRPGLVACLQAYLDLPEEEVGRRISVNESQAGNFVIGEDTGLGDELVMGGPDEEACHVTVTLTWPGSLPPETAARLEEIIRAWKPAHTTIELQLRNGR